MACLRSGRLLQLSSAGSSSSDAEITGRSCLAQGGAACADRPVGDVRHSASNRVLLPSPSVVLVTGNLAATPCHHRADRLDAYHLLLDVAVARRVEVQRIEQVRPKALAQLTLADVWDARRSSIDDR